ncbi:MAG: hypothetical protein QG553_508 [Patescibacteria group bacterium]|nr:hypothetical protein [Patescibacteria group bacterium]
MKAHFIASGTNLKADIHNYRNIVRYIESLNVSLTRNWLEPAYKRSKSNIKNPVSWQDVYRSNLEAVSKADIIVAEISRKSFLVGFQVANALQQKKPILLLSDNDQVETAIGASIDEDIIQYAKYTPKNLEEVIGKFIDQNKVKKKDLKFNFFIDRKILNYLNWASFHSGDTKSEIIRKALLKEIDRSEFNK